MKGGTPLLPDELAVMAGYSLAAQDLASAICIIQSNIQHNLIVLAPCAKDLLRWILHHWNGSIESSSGRIAYKTLTHSSSDSKGTLCYIIHAVTPKADRTRVVVRINEAQHGAIVTHWPDNGKTLPTSGDLKPTELGSSPLPLYTFDNYADQAFQQMNMEDKMRARNHAQQITHGVLGTPVTPLHTHPALQIAPSGHTTNALAFGSFLIKQPALLAPQFGKSTTGTMSSGPRNRTTEWQFNPFDAYTKADSSQPPSLLKALCETFPDMIQPAADRWQDRCQCGCEGDAMATWTWHRLSLVDACKRSMSSRFYSTQAMLWQRRQERPQSLRYREARSRPSI